MVKAYHETASLCVREAECSRKKDPENLPLEFSNAETLVTFTRAVLVKYGQQQL